MKVIACFVTLVLLTSCSTSTLSIQSVVEVADSNTSVLEASQLTESNVLSDPFDPDDFTEFFGKFGLFMLHPIESAEELKDESLTFPFVMSLGWYYDKHNIERKTITGGTYVYPVDELETISENILGFAYDFSEAIEAQKDYDKDIPDGYIWTVLGVDLERWSQIRPETIAYDESNQTITMLADGVYRIENIDLVEGEITSSPKAATNLTYGTYMSLNDIFTDPGFAPQVSFYSDGRYEMVVNYLHGLCTIYGTHYVEGDMIYAEITNWNNSPVEGFMPGMFDFNIIDSNNVTINQGYYGISPGDTFRLIAGEA